ncbi:MAG: hypothetical protein ACE5HA_08385 [Anaerolineae bacterium]
MSVARAVWSASLRSGWNAVRYDPQARVTSIVAFGFSLAGGVWGVHRLVSRVLEWQAGGQATLAGKLWLLSLAVWTGLSFLAVLTFLQLGFGNDRFVLYLTAPITPATRFRILYGLVLLEGLWSWLPLAAGVMAVSLALTVGWPAVQWTVLLMVGAAFAVWCSAVVTLRLICFIAPHQRKWFRFSVVVGLGVIVLATAGLAITQTSNPPSPYRATILLAALLVVGLGPLAGWAGRLHRTAFHIIEGRSGAKTAVTVPGIRLMSQLLARNRSLTGAFFVKGVLNRSRNTLSWARVVAILVYLALYPQIRSAVAGYGVPDTLVVVGYTALLCVLTIIDSAPSPIGSEGNRLALYLTAPFEMGEILRAKLALFLVPILLMGLTITLLLGRGTGLTGNELGFSVIAVVLILIGDTALIVLGSAWDEDLDLALEGAMQTLLHEEAPITVRRLWLLNLSLLLLVVGLTLVWKLPAVLALPALVLLDGVVLVVAWRFSNTYLRRLLAFS